MAANKIFIPKHVQEIEDGIENRILNTFKDSRGRQLKAGTAIPILTDSGWWYIAKVIRPFWLSPEYLTVDVLLKKKIEDSSDGLYVSLELALGTERRGGIIVNWGQTNLHKESLEYSRRFENS